jgi:hypothetical protein
MPNPAGSTGGTPHSGSVEAAAKAMEGLFPEDGEPDKKATPAAIPAKPAPTSVVDEPEEPQPDDAPSEGHEAEEEVAVVEDGEAPPADEEIVEEPVVDGPRKLKVKTGETFEEIPETEVVNGYLRQKDYTQKTQKLSTERKEFETQRDAILAERREYAESLTQLRTAIESQTAAPDWTKLKLTMEPAEFAAEYSAWDHQQKQIDKLRVEERAAHDKVQGDLAAKHREYLDAEKERLLDAIPEWRKSPEVGKKERAAMLAYALEQGFDEAEIKGLADHRAMVLLHKAFLFDQGKAGVAKAKAKINAVRVATPGASKPATPPAKKAYNEAKATARATGRITDVARQIEKMNLGDEDA